MTSCGKGIATYTPVTYGFAFTRDGEAIARGKITSVCCRVKGAHELQPIPIPESYKKRLLGA